MDFFDILLAKKLEDDRDPIIEGLSVTENGTYREEGKAYSPVIVEVPEPTLITKSITANGTYNASDDDADGYSSVTVAVEGFKKKSIANTPTDIASFNDGTANPMPSLEISIEPVQDLHGYDNPWVGGAGKNKINVPDGKVTSAGYIFNLADLNLPAGTYTLSGQSSPTLQQSITSFAVATGSTTPINRGISFPFTFTVENNITGLRLYTTTTCEYYNIQLEVGSSATSYAPYSNICPINGHTEADVAVTGVNIWDEEMEVGGVSYTTGNNVPYDDRLRTKNYISVTPNTTYRFINPLSGTGYWQYCWYDENKTFISGDSTRDIGVKTAPSNARYLRFGCPPSYGTTYYYDISINYPSTDTSYHSYNGKMFYIPFHDNSDNPITVYGGRLNVTSGELTATHANIASYNGETINEPWISSMDAYSAGTTPTTGAQIVYPLATPQTYQLTPTQVTTLLNQNNIFADCGQILQGEYFVTL